MIDRIQLILKSKNLSPSQFADEIKVQRSSISHILSGRNKPSLDFVMKILSTYPEVNADWLIFGKGQMVKQEKSDPKMIEPKNIDLFQQEKEEEKIKPVSSSPAAQHPTSTNRNETIKKIVVFYNNGTFQEYKHK
jgi:transcriptional regulator with XRE-family HTH domain